MISCSRLLSIWFKINFLVKWSAGGISKFKMQSLFFVIKIFFQFVNSCLFDAITGLLWFVCFSFHTWAATANFSISPFFLFLKFSLTLVSFCLSYIYLLAILAINLKFLISFLKECYLSSWNSKEFYWRIVLRREYHVVVSEYSVKFIMCPWIISKLFVGDILI